MFSRRQILAVFPLIYMALSLAHAQAVPPPSGPDAAQSTASGQLSPSKLVFANEEFSLYNTGRINNGWAVYYTVKGENPDSAQDEIIVNHLQARNQQGQVILAVQVARAMLDNVRSRGGVIIKPFAVPDKSRPGNEYFTYYATFYYVYPQSGVGDVWLSRIFLSDAGPESFLYRHVIGGDNPTAIEQAIRRWLGENLTSYGAALATLTVPDGPPAAAAPRPSVGN